jgi:hypothetical protein
MTTDDPDDQRTDMATATAEDRARDGKGRFTRDLTTARRDAEIAKMRIRGMRPRDIAAQLGVDESTVSRACQRVADEARQESAGEMRQLELERLDRMEVAVNEVLEREHVTVSQGRIVRRRVLDEDGDPIVVAHDRDGKPVFREEEVLDDGPVLQAVDRLLKIQQRRAALLGLDAPVKAETGVTLNYTIVGVDMEQL